jgi:uncharacterized protein YndB with AHSA1/START domain
LQTGYLVLADVSGYTGFLAGTELEHAQDVMRELLELIIHRLTPTLTLAKLEGDAVFVYAPESRVSRGEMLMELVESTYIAFRDHVRSIQQRTTCTCAACRAIPTLDLKFMTHYGTFVPQTVAGHSEIVGSDVNLAHRLLKNSVRDETGWKAYALFTRACLDHIGVAPTAMHIGSESYEHLGSVEVCSLDLHHAYQTAIEGRHIKLDDHEADVALVYDFDAPPPVVWDWMNDPYKRTLWFGGPTWSSEPSESGRIGVGTRNHCAHGGKDASVETILDWHPFDYVTSRQTGGPMLMLNTVQLEPHGTGTRIYYRVKLESRLPKALRQVIAKLIFTRVYDMRPRWAEAASLMAAAQATTAATPVTTPEAGGSPA